MARRRPAFFPVLMVLAALVLLGSGAAGQPAATPAPSGSVAAVDDDLLAAVAPDQREAVAGQADTMPRYTIAANLLPPMEPVAAPPEPAPVASPQASPVAPVASPAASPSASPVASPPATPVDTVAGAGEADPASVATVAAPMIVGTLDLHYINTTGASIESLPVRLNPNLRQYGSGAMAIANVHVDGEPVEAQAPALHSAPEATPIPIENAGERDLAIVEIPLGEPLEDGAAVRVRMDFSTIVPIDPPDENGLFRYTPDTGTWTLAHWFPLLAGWDPDGGWDTDPPAVWSDITFANTALFDITLTAPDDLVLVTTGVEVGASASGDVRTSRITTGPVRDVAMIAEPGLTAVSADVGGTTISSWHRAGEEAGSEVILQWAAQALEIYTELFGPYPYTSLDLVSVPAVVGYEFPQLIFIGAGFYPDPENLGSRPGAIEFLVAHEVAHQWWYGLVGSNPHRHAFLDEGLTEYSTILYFERQHGEEAAAAHLRDGLTHRYAFMLVTAGDQIADQPTVAFPDGGAYYATVYRKAGLGFAAIRDEIGDEAFVDALRAYAEEHRFGVASPSDLRAAFEAASGEELGDLWALWFEADRGRVEIAMEPLPATPDGATPAASPVAATPVASVPPEASPVASPVSSAATPVAVQEEPATPAASPVAVEVEDATPMASPRAVE